MRNKLLCGGGILLIVCCFGLSYFYAEWYGGRVIGETFPLSEENYLLSAPNNSEINMEDVMTVFSRGNIVLEAPISMSEFENFVFIDNVMEQLDIITEEQWRPAAKYAKPFNIMLERYALEGYADVYIWRIEFSWLINSDKMEESMTVYYHDNSNQIIKIESKNEIIKESERISKAVYTEAVQTNKNS
jgi:hypothetical protein